MRMLSYNHSNGNNKSQTINVLFTELDDKTTRKSLSSPLHWRQKTILMLHEMFMSQKKASSTQVYILLPVVSIHSTPIVNL